MAPKTDKITRYGMDRPTYVYMRSAGLEDELRVGTLKKDRNFETKKDLQNFIKD